MYVFRRKRCFQEGQRAEVILPGEVISLPRVSCSSVFTVPGMMLQLCQNQDNCIIHQIEHKPSLSDSCPVIRRFPSEARRIIQPLLPMAVKKKYGPALQVWATKIGEKKKIKHFPKIKNPANASAGSAVLLTHS